MAWLGTAGAAVGVLARGARHDWRTGDTVTLVKSLSQISNCLGHGRFSHCTIPGAPMDTVAPFPATQMAPAYLFHVLGVGDSTLIGLLVWINAAIIVGFTSVLLWWSYRRGGAGLAVVAGFLFVPGMLLAYTAQSFGEPLAAVAFGGVALAGLRRDRVSPWLALAALAATASKDTAAPFVLLLGAAAIALSGCGRDVVRRAAVHLVAGVAAGELIGVLFNVFRYGRLTNRFYLSFLRSTNEMIANSFAGQLVSPNGGIVWFWPGVAIAVLALLVLAVRGRGMALPFGRARLGGALAVIAFVGYALSLAFWWQPYGWYAWGPRLLMPIGPAVIVLAVAAIGTPACLARWTSIPALLGLGGLGIVALAPTVGVVYDYHAYTAQVRSVWQTNRECLPRPPSAFPTKESRREYTEHCIRLQAWETRSLNLTRAVPGAYSGHEVYWATMLGGAVAIGAWGVAGYRAPRRDARAGQPVQDPPPVDDPPVDDPPVDDPPVDDPPVDGLPIDDPPDPAVIPG